MEAGRAWDCKDEPIVFFTVSTVSTVGSSGRRENLFLVGMARLCEQDGREGGVGKDQLPAVPG